MVKSTDLTDVPGVFIETRSPADVSVMVSVSGTEVERARLHAILVVGVSPNGEAPSTSTVTKI